MSQTPCVTTVFEPEMWDNESEATRCGNTEWPLTRSSVVTREKAPMKTTRPFDLVAWLQHRVTIDHVGCWIWKHSTSKGGYVWTRMNGQRGAGHRLVYELLVGPIPDGLELDHLCRVHNCLNPDHLEPVTKAENIRRGYSFSAMRARRTDCPNGHPFSGPNLINEPRGRRCRECTRVKDAKAWQRRKIRNRAA